MIAFLSLCGLASGCCVVNDVIMMCYSQMHSHKDTKKEEILLVDYYLRNERPFDWVKLRILIHSPVTHEIVINCNIVF
jgi:hypothetical protein